MTTEISVMYGSEKVKHSGEAHNQTDSCAYCDQRRKLIYPVQVTQKHN